MKSISTEVYKGRMGILINVEVDCGSLYIYIAIGTSTETGWRRRCLWEWRVCVCGGVYLWPYVEATGQPLGISFPLLPYLGQVPFVACCWICEASCPTPSCLPKEMAGVFSLPGFYLGSWDSPLVLTLTKQVLYLLRHLSSPMQHCITLNLHEWLCWVYSIVEEH